MPGDAPSFTTWRGRGRRALLFTGATFLAFPLALIPPRPPGGGGFLLLAAVVFVAVALSITFVPWHLLPESTKLTMVAGFCLGVALLRHSAGGSTGGYAPLLLLPVIWQALYGRTIDLAITVVAVAATHVLPIVLIGGEAYPVSGLRSATLSSMTFTVAAVTVQQLLARIRRHEEMLGSVVELTRGLGDAKDVRRRTVAGLQRLAGPDVVVFSELDGAGRLRVTASTDPAMVAAVEDAPASWRIVLERGEQQFAARTDHDAAPFRSVLHQPVKRGATPVALVTLGWSDRRARPPTSARQAVELVAAEAAVAVERADLVERVTRLARHDELTGLANRRNWDEHLVMEMSRADRTGSSLCVAILDLDHFKRFNDAHGHLAGDRLLKAATAAWSSQLRPTDLLARWGGEEFALALPETDLAGAVQVIERLRANTPMDQTFSAGVTEVDGPRRAGRHAGRRLGALPGQGIGSRPGGRLRPHRPRAVRQRRHHILKARGQSNPRTRPI